MSRLLFTTAFIIGALAIAWISTLFIGSDILALGVTLVIAGVYAIGFVELQKFRRATTTLDMALDNLPDEVGEIDSWLSKLDVSLQNAVRMRIESERVGLPAPVLTPYLVGLLVMLGLLGTFVGMVDTLQGAVFALEGSTELQAIREGLAAPINGLSLAFGTSVAGVAASAMLGLSSTLSRRDRIIATRQLDTKIGTVFKNFSLHHNRQQTYKAMQAQAQALPNIALQLQTVADSVAKMTSSLSEELITNQNEFHQSVTTAYTNLAASVDKSLTESLAESGRQVGESIKPLVVETMSEISKEAKNSQQHLTATAQLQLQTMSESLGETSLEVTKAWQAGLEAQQQSNATLINELSSTNTAMLAAFDHSATNRQQQFEQSFEKIQQGASEQLTASSKVISGELGEITNSQQLAFSAATVSFTTMSQQLEKSLASMQNDAATQLVETAKLISRELKDVTNTQQLSFTAATASFANMSEQLSGQWQQTGERMDELSTALGKELSTLRIDEDKRANAALERIEGLETTFASHISNLGKELEEPMTRLIQTASETPKAAAEVIEKLRVEISNNIERDNDLLIERKEIMKQLASLSSSLNASSQQQREAVEHLVTTSTTMLSQVGTQFTGHVDGELDKISAVADQFSGSAIEMASLSQSFVEAVKLYSESNSHLVDHLNRIEQSMDNSNNRSDEQMAYYVAQAREIIDHSLLSQKEVFEKMRQLSEAS